MIGVLRTVIFIVGLYYIIRFISRYILPLFAEKTPPVPKKNTDNPVQNPKYSADDGEYVDFEEIK